MSAGPRGAKLTVGTSGAQATAGLPGAGLHYTVLNPHKKSWVKALSLSVQDPLAHRYQRLPQGLQVGANGRVVEVERVAEDGTRDLVANAALFGEGELGAIAQ
jgi:hypothetical protein